jgi:exonuclease VII small subunit
LPSTQPLTAPVSSIDPFDRRSREVDNCWLLLAGQSHSDIRLEDEMWKKEDETGTQRLPASMATYSEAVDEFSKQATEFLTYMPLLTKARDAYQRAMAVSAEVRSMLDAGDKTLQTLMTQLEEAVSVHLSKASADKKKPESVKVEPARATTGTTDSSWALPK